MASDHVPARYECRPDLGMHTSNGFSDRNRLEARQEMLDEGTAACPARSLGAMDAVQEFADGDDADRTIFVADELFDRRPFLLVEHEQVGID